MVMGKPVHPKSVSEYRARINRVTDYISEHLSEDLSLVELAKVACFSPYHFHRLFTAITEETLNDYVRRSRLQAAACMLLYQHDVPITLVAMECGFGSSSVLGRAFRAYFGMSATEWRNGGSERWLASCRNGKKCKKDRKGRKSNSSEKGYHFSRIKKEFLDRIRKEIFVKVEIQKLPAYRVAYMRAVGPYGPGIMGLWQRFLNWCHVRELMTPDTYTFGTCLDDPSITPPAKCRYDACIEVPPDFRVSGEVGVREIRGGKYAVFPFEGDATTVQLAWQQVFSEWLPQSGLQPDGADCFERYKGDCWVDKGRGIFRCEICVPVRAL